MLIFTRNLPVQDHQRIVVARMLEIDDVFADSEPPGFAFLK